MYMTIQQILREKNLSRYQLSKKSGVPWATLADICSGKTTLSRCSAGTLMKLSSTLDIPMEQLITLTVEKPQMHGGKPTDRTYLEKNLPASLNSPPCFWHTASCGAFRPGSHPAKAPVLVARPARIP